MLEEERMLVEAKENFTGGRRNWQRVAKSGARMLHCSFTTPVSFDWAKQRSLALAIPALSLPVSLSPQNFKEIPGQACSVGQNVYPVLPRIELYPSRSYTKTRETRKAFPSRVVSS